MGKRSDQLVVFPLLGVAGLFATALWILLKGESLGRTDIQLSEFAEGRIDIKISSDYVEKYGAIGDGLYPHENLVEMYQLTRLTAMLKASPKKNSVEKEEPVWSISGTAAKQKIVEGWTAEVRFVHLGDHRVQVSIGSIFHEFIVSARYVRREVRDLTENDRLAYFNAMSIIYRTDQAKGIELYGSQFLSAAWLVREHLYGAASKDCDHWHDDAGFMNHHFGITMQFEQSLQSVDPAVASHYWDYTKDAWRGDNFTQSIIFHDDWYGPVDGDSDHILASGRWAYTPILTNARSFSNITNPYGLLRSPWNTSPVPYLMRSRYTLGVKNAMYSLPSCSDFSNILETDHLTFSGLSAEINGGLHGQVHIMLGGHWGANTSFIQKMKKHTTQMQFSSPHISDQMLLASKFLWRQGFVHCPNECNDDADQPQKPCACHCPAEVMMGRSPFEILHLSGLLSVLPQIETVLVHTIGFTYDEIFDELCHFGHPGEMFTSAAPQDPVFWPLHGLAERFVQLIRILAFRKLLSFDETWKYNHVSNLLSDTHLICDWSQVEDTFDRPTCTQNLTCPGHRAHDTLPFHNLNWAPPGAYFTNEQFYEALAPTNTKLPYVYDRLTTWPSCPDHTIIPTAWRSSIIQ